MFISHQTSHYKSDKENQLKLIASVHIRSLLSHKKKYKIISNKYDMGSSFLLAA